MHYDLTKKKRKFLIKPELNSAVVVVVGGENAFSFSIYFAI